jgi:hypothetical protein
MESNKTEIEEKRIKSIAGVFFKLIELGGIDGEKFILNRSLLKSVVTHYLQDLQVLKMRYGIEDKAQPQKVAGLTAAAVMRFKPVLPKNSRDENLFKQDANELLAAFHGLCVCTAQGNGNIDMHLVEDFLSMREFPEWLSNLRYMLKFRSYTSESLAMIFDTLTRFAK